MKEVGAMTIGMIEEENIHSQGQEIEIKKKTKDIKMKEEIEMIEGIEIKEEIEAGIETEMMTLTEIVEEMILDREEKIEVIATREDKGVIVTKTATGIKSQKRIHISKREDKLRESEYLTLKKPMSLRLSFKRR